MPPILLLGMRALLQIFYLYFFIHSKLALCISHQSYCNRSSLHGLPSSALWKPLQVMIL